jgi:hypothetical protein
MQLAGVETSLEELNLRGAGEEQSHDPEDMANTVKQIKEERGALSSSRQLLKSCSQRLKRRLSSKRQVKVRAVQRI